MASSLAEGGGCGALSSLELIPPDHWITGESWRPGRWNGQDPSDFAVDLSRARLFVYGNDDQPGCSGPPRKLDCSGDLCMDCLLLRFESTARDAGTGGGALDQRAEQLAASLRRLQGALPRVDIELSVERVVLEGSRFSVGCASLVPVADRGSLRVELCGRERRLLVAFWGELLVATDPVRAVVEAYRRGGADAVSLLDGNFGAVIFDAAADRAEVVADSIGRRALRYAYQQGVHWVSTHDAALVAAGAVQVSFDPVSVLSSAVVENCLGRQALLRDVVALAGTDVLSLNSEACAKPRSRPIADLSARASMRDPRSLSEIRERVLERTVDGTRGWVRGASRIICDLTAGMDSRAGLAFLVRAGASRRLTCQTSGGESTVDYRTAAKLTKILALRHRASGAADPQPEHFADSVRLRAFAMNGDTDAKRGVRAGGVWSRPGTLRVEGTAGEIYRGYYYQYYGLTGEVPHAPKKVADVMLSRRFRRFRSMPLADEVHRHALRQRLYGLFEAYAEDGIVGGALAGSDLVDLFYLKERCAHWGAISARSPWVRVVNPFLVPSAVREAYLFPAPLGKTSGIHSHAIQRYLPDTYWVPINGGKFLALEGTGRARFALRQALVGAGYLTDFARAAFSHKPEGSQSNVQAALFADQLYPYIHDLLTAQGSVAGEVFSVDAVESTLERHRSSRSQLARLGYWVCHEAYRQLLLGVVPGRH